MLAVRRAFTSNSLTHLAANSQKIRNLPKAPPMPNIYKFLDGCEVHMPDNAYFSILHPELTLRSLEEIREIFRVMGKKNHDDATGRLLTSVMDKGL